MVLSLFRSLVSRFLQLLHELVLVGRLRKIHHPMQNHVEQHAQFVLERASGRGVQISRQSTARQQPGRRRRARLARHQKRRGVGCARIDARASM